jgi:hypothetical protein
MVLPRAFSFARSLRSDRLLPASGWVPRPHMSGAAALGARSWRDPAITPALRLDLSGRAQPRPTNGMAVAITVRNWTLASSGRLAM